MDNRGRGRTRKGQRLWCKGPMLLRMGKLPAWLAETVSKLEVTGCDGKRGPPREGQDGDEFLGRWTLDVGPNPEALGQAGWTSRVTDSKGSISYPPLSINHSSMHVVGILRADRRWPPRDGKWEGLQAGGERSRGGQRSGAGYAGDSLATERLLCVVLRQECGHFDGGWVGWTRRWRYGNGNAIRPRRAERGEETTGWWGGCCCNSLGGIMCCNLFKLKQRKVPRGTGPPQGSRACAGSAAVVRPRV